MTPYIVTNKDMAAGPAAAMATPFDAADAGEAAVKYAQAEFTEKADGRVVSVNNGKGERRFKIAVKYIPCITIHELVKAD